MVFPASRTVLAILIMDPPVLLRVCSAKRKNQGGIFYAANEYPTFGRTRSNFSQTKTTDLAAPDFHELSGETMTKLSVLLGNM